MVDPMALLALVAQRSEDYGWLIFELLHVTFDFFKKIFNIQQIMEYDNLYTVWVADPFPHVWVLLVETKK